MVDFIRVKLTRIYNTRVHTFLLKDYVFVEK